jgi:hypothetical protein
MSAAFRCPSKDINFKKPSARVYVFALVTVSKEGEMADWEHLDMHAKYYIRISHGGDHDGIRVLGCDTSMPCFLSWLFNDAVNIETI